MPGMHKILIVDDEESIRFAMSEYFLAHSNQVDCAQSVEEAEAYLAAGSYSAVIADLRLTGQGDMGGLEVVKSVHERQPGTPVVVLTAHRSPEIEEKVRQHGVKALLRKPKPLPDVAQIVFDMIEASSAKPSTS